MLNNNIEFVIYFSNTSHQKGASVVSQSNINNAHCKKKEKHRNDSYGYTSIVLGAPEFKVGPRKGHSIPRKSSRSILRGQKFQKSLALLLVYLQLKNSKSLLNSLLKCTCRMGEIDQANRLGRTIQLIQGWVP